MKEGVLHAVEGMCVYEKGMVFILHELTRLLLRLWRVKN